MLIIKSKSNKDFHIINVNILGGLLGGAIFKMPTSRSLLTYKNGNVLW